MYIENIVIRNPIVDPSLMFAKDEDDWNSIEKEKTYLSVHFRTNRHATTSDGCSIGRKPHLGWT